MMVAQIAMPDTTHAALHPTASMTPVSRIGASAIIPADTVIDRPIASPRRRLNHNAIPACAVRLSAP